MRKILSVVLALAVVLVFVGGVRAADEVLKGTITCAKCDLKKQDTCATVIVVKKDGKDMVYYFDPAAGKKYHKKICTEPMKGEVKGTVKKEGDKMIVTVKELKFEE
jgi:hypothetical protein